MVGGPPAGAYTTSQLTSKTLSLNNLPTGWSVSSFDTLTELLPDCLSGLQLLTATHHAMVSVSFQDGTLPILQEELGWVSYGASDDYKLIVQALRGCRGPLYASLDAVPATVTVKPISYRTYGNRSAAFAVGTSFFYEGRKLSTGTDLVIFQVNRVVGLVLYGELGIPPPSLSGSFVTEAIDKLEGKAIPLSLLRCEVTPSCPAS
jgi:hypothetical protein